MAGKTSNVPADGFDERAVEMTALEAIQKEREDLEKFKIQMFAEIDKKMETVKAVTDDKKPIFCPVKDGHMVAVYFTHQVFNPHTKKYDHKKLPEWVSEEHPCVEHSVQIDTFNTDNELRPLQPGEKVAPGMKITKAKDAAKFTPGMILGYQEVPNSPTIPKVVIGEDGVVREAI